MILNKNQVDIAKVGEVRPGTASHSFLADFRISVVAEPNSFETTATDVPCDRNGIPTEDSIAKLREAVEDIKTKIRQLQN